MSNNTTNAVGVQQTTLAKNPDLITTNVGDPGSTDRHLSGETNIRLTAALDLARRGFRVFPVVENDKRPLIENWPDKASSDSTQISKVWTEFLT